jgi:1-acyl-sn-glycerol-3-phosphate acyltransferase
MHNEFRNIPKVNPVLRWFATFAIWAMGWRFEGRPPDVPKMVMIGAPHTSNLDVFLMVMMAWKLGIRVNYLVANDLSFPLNKLSVWANGIQIDRNNPNSNTVQQVIDYMNTVDKCVLMIAPEGRLRKVQYWGSGFYYIALGAGLPVVPGYMDYPTKKIHLTDALYPSGDIEADMDGLREFYSKATARFPERAGPVQVRPRTEKMQQRLTERHIGYANEAAETEHESTAQG